MTSGCENKSLRHRLNHWLFDSLNYLDEKFGMRAVKHKRLYVFLHGYLRFVFGLAVMLLAIMMFSAITNLLLSLWVATLLCAFFGIAVGSYVGTPVWNHSVRRAKWMAYDENLETLGMEDKGEALEYGVGARRLRTNVSRTVGHNRCAVSYVEWVDVVINPETGEEFEFTTSNPDKFKGVIVGKGNHDHSS